MMKNEMKAALKLTAFGRMVSTRRRVQYTACCDKLLDAFARRDNLESQQSRALNDIAIACVRVKVSFQRTYVDMPFHWMAKRDGYGREYYYHELTGERTWEKPRFSWEEEWAARQLQRAYKGMLGRKLFLERFEMQSSRILSPLEYVRQAAWHG